MEIQGPAHPSRLQLAAFALGQLASERRERLQEHVASCASCAEFISDTPPDVLASLLREARTLTRPLDDLTPCEDKDDSFTGILPLNLPRVARGSEDRPDSGGDAQSQFTTPHAPLGDDLVPQGLREQTKYRIVRLLGSGGMGSVYEAYHERMDRQVAIKVVNSALVDHPGALKRFDQEIKAAAKLDHPNVARAYDADELGSLPALVMEYVPGQSLDRVLARRGRVGVAEAAGMVRQAMIGLDHAHVRGMVHRDLKPQNLMLTPDGKVKILDFGLAKMASERRVNSGLTRDNVMLGTPHYLAPEQALDAAKADIRADIYSLGCTLYCLLAGRRRLTARRKFRCCWRTSATCRDRSVRSALTCRGNCPISWVAC